MNPPRRMPSSGQGPLAEIAYVRLREAIRNRDFEPGTRMRESDLAESLGISRTPLRDALKQLEADGLLEALPRRGLVVASMDEQRLTEIYALRHVLEILAARLAAQQATRAEIAKMRRNLTQQAATLPTDVAALIRLNQQFHDIVYRASRNRYLVAAAYQLSAPLALLPGTTYSTPGRPAEALKQHTALLDAIEARDEDLAEAAAAAHMESGHHIRLDLLAEIEEPVV